MRSRVYDPPTRMLLQLRLCTLLHGSPWTTSTSTSTTLATTTHQH